MLSSSRIASYLVEHGLLSSSDFNEDRVRIEKLPSRNQSYLVHRRNRPFLFLKHAADGHGALSLAHEADVYKFLNQMVLSAQDAHVPRLVRFDSEARLLILEATNGRSIAADLFEIRQSQSPTVPARLGQIVAAFHQCLTGESRHDRRKLNESHARMPPVFEYITPGVRAYRSMSPAQAAVIARIQQFPELWLAIEEAKHSWREEAMIHGDLSLSNILIEDQTRSIVILDWELAHFGDPDWDVATIVAEILGQWVLSMPVGPDGQVDEMVRRASLTTNVVAEAIEQFWSAYSARVRRSSETGQTAEFIRMFRFAGIRLFQKAMEHAQSSARSSAHDIVLSQIGMNITLQPAQMASFLFGRTIG